MSTTAIVIEHLISGVQAFIWLVLLYLSVFSPDWKSMEPLKDYPAQLSFVALAIVYPFGVLIDEVADKILKTWSHRIRNNRFYEEGLSYNENDVTAFLILQAAKDNFLTAYFNYVRMRIRISRSAAFNSCVLSITVVIYTVFRTSYTWKILLIEIVVGVVATFLFLWGWSRVTDTFATQISKAYKSQNRKQANNEKEYYG